MTDVAEEDPSPVAGPRCSQVAAALAEPLGATAPYARGWLVIEQPGPWGRQALTESRLPDGLGGALAEHAEGTGTTVLLARSTGRGQELRRSSRRRFWVAHTSPGGVRMRSGVLADVGVLAGVDLAAVARGELPAMGRHDRDPVMFICANARRDTCCAIEGRALAAELDARGPSPSRPRRPGLRVLSRRRPPLRAHGSGAAVGDRPWPGHRGRGGGPAVGRGRRAAPAAGYRGRSAFRRWAQAAELASGNVTPTSTASTTSTCSG